METRYLDVQQVDFKYKILIEYFCKQLEIFLNPFFSASESFDGTYQTNVVVTSAGRCTYIPPGIFKSSCQIGRVSQ